MFIRIENYALIVIKMTIVFYRFSLVQPIKEEIPLVQSEEIVLNYDYVYKLEMESKLLAADKQKYRTEQTNDLNMTTERK